jgi:hypothetical protein
MGERGDLTYVRGVRGRAWKLAKPGARGAFVAELSFSEDDGVSVAFRGPNGFQGVLYVPFYEDPGSGIEDERFVKELVDRKLLDEPKGRELVQRLKAKDRVAWALAHGLEAVLGFPPAELEPPHVVFTEENGIVVLQPPPTVPVASGASRGWTAAERKVVDLHIHYWREIWSMNSWSLYNRYKKHLPAAERRDVDALASAVGMGDDAAIPRTVESILSRIWDADDWDAVIRSPKLDDPGTDEGAAREWRRMLGREP